MQSALYLQHHNSEDKKFTDNCQGKKSSVFLNDNNKKMVDMQTSKKKKNIQESNPNCHTSQRKEERIA